MKKTLGYLRKADQDFHLIESGDKIAVGVSGGKDSLLLLHAMSLYRRFSHKDFSLLAVTVTMGFEPFDLTMIRRLCDDLEIDYCVRETEIGKIIFDYRKRKIPVRSVPKCAGQSWQIPVWKKVLTNLRSAITGRMRSKRCSCLCFMKAVSTPSIHAPK